MPVTPTMFYKGTWFSFPASTALAGHGFPRVWNSGPRNLGQHLPMPPNTDEYTRLFIEALHWPTLHLDIVSLILNTENFCSHWWKAQESTSSSFSSLHFCHSYKVAVSTPTIAHLHAHFTQLVFMSGILLSWYQSGLQMILEKSRSNTCGSLQAILLMEVDFNATMKILIGHWMVCNAIKSHAVPQDFFRSLPEHTAIQVSLNRCLVGDVS